MTPCQTIITKMEKNLKFHLDFQILMTEENSVTKINPWTTYNPTYLHVETIKLITYCAGDQGQLCHSLIGSDVLLSTFSITLCLF